jgi:pyoverdine/dityrosine biosynthesis protein Dit1
VKTSIASQILDLVFEIRNLTKVSDESMALIADSKNRQFQIAKIEAFMAAGTQIHMILPAFPAKSPNPRKTVSSMPDYGEVLALTRLNNLCEDIKALYEPGAHITICSDGRVFSDVVQVSDCAVEIYGREIQRIITEHTLPNLSTFSLDDVFSAHNYDLMRSRLFAEFAEDLETLRARVKSDDDTKSLFNGIHRFMFEDQLALNPEKSKSGLRESSKVLAYEVIRRSNAWSRLVEQKFPESLRLSIHPQSVNSTKIGVRLIPSNDLWRTPWHSVTVFDGSDYFLAPREQAEAAGGVLTYANDKYPYYVVSKAVGL